MINSDKPRGEKNEQLVSVCVCERENIRAQEIERKGIFIYAMLPMNHNLAGSVPYLVTRIAGRIRHSP